ncbi:MAG: hypothetical protein FWC91_00620 [Defluviitaleaceae bacterium]|nr:hypothetical protein [Defluviitaleaceae bacterium]
MKVKPLEKLPVYLCTIAAIIVLLACIAVGAQLFTMAMTVSVTIVVFFIVGIVVRIFLIPLVQFPENEEPLVDDERFFAVEIEGTSEIDNDFDESTEENEPVEDAFLDS